MVSLALYPRFYTAMVNLVVILNYLFSIVKFVNIDSYPSVSKISKFLNKIIFKLQLSIEWILITLIYVERIMLKSINSSNGKLVIHDLFIGWIHIRNMNWKSIVLGSLIWASKFWEGFEYWNTDFQGIVLIVI